MAEAAELRTMRRGVEALYRDLHRGLWPRPLHVRKQFPAGQGSGQLPGDFQRLQAALGRGQRKRQDQAVLQDGEGFLSIAAAVAYPGERSDTRGKSRMSLSLMRATSVRLRQPAIRLAGWRWLAGRNILRSFRKTRSAKPNQTGEVLRQKASFLTWPSTCHFACAPS